MVKKYKKMKNNFSNMGQNNTQGLTIKEPFMYTEEILRQDFIGSEFEVLADMSQIFPFGYYVSSFLT